MVGQMVTLRTSLRSGVAPRCSEGSSGGCCGLLDRATVVVLVTVEGSPSGKSFLTISIGALIRPLAKVRSSVPSKRAAVTEALP